MKKRAKSKAKKSKPISPVEEAASFAVEQDIAVLLSTLVQKLSSFETKLDAVLKRVETTPAVNTVPVQIPIPSQTPPRVQPAERPRRPMYTAVCFECGEDCEIPFKPSGNRPVIPSSNVVISSFNP